ncbi:FAD NAD(P)-binding domain-containing [Lecanosticta acicola]|uniref:FAD NAD(P)-binding domain-containing n=1 Tax=Lecanosticta acicola TaxID=111012 RepID=A0AAI8YTP7_9PEZI|nr:FAD NAD(P)-binding domain-containing [Lecanosticta acicola]
MAQAGDVSGHDGPLDVLIIGGSLGGLMSGILLKRSGHNVRILEQAASSEREGLAAGIGLAFQVKRFFETEDRLKDKPMGILNSGVSIVDDNLRVRYKLALDMNLTSWDSAYYRARWNFDGHQSAHCPETPLAAAASEGYGEYLTGKSVQKVEDVQGRLTAFVTDAKTGATEQYSGDIVIAADGANSTLRRQLHPNLQREEPGYVIWRGTIPTSELSQDVLDKIENRPVIYPGPQTYCVIYTIPGENGSLAQGTRHINMAWYFWPSKASLEEIMTDVDGHHHRSTVPKGKMRPEVWQPQVEQARRLLPKPLVSLVENIQSPFVSVVSSITAPNAVYFNNRLFMIGDALTQSQPNIGMGTSLAANAAISLVNEVICPENGEGSPPRLSPERIEAWERKVLQENEITRCRSVSFASWYLNSWPLIGYYFARYYAKLYWQYYFGGREKKWEVLRRV